MRRGEKRAEVAESSSARRASTKECSVLPGAADAGPRSRGPPHADRHLGTAATAVAVLRPMARRGPV